MKKGGLPISITPRDNIIKEAMEEAGISEEKIQSCVMVSMISSFMDAGVRGLIPDVGINLWIITLFQEFVYDLPVDEHFLPVPNDDEMESFELMTAEKVYQHLVKGEFTPDSALVIIDFFIRHGIINTENEPQYVEIVTNLHRPLPFPFPRFNNFNFVQDCAKRM